MIQLKKQKIEAEITGRAKHLYSIFRKMQRDNKTLDQIYDLFALRIIVNSVKEHTQELQEVLRNITLQNRLTDRLVITDSTLLKNVMIADMKQANM